MLLAYDFGTYLTHSACHTPCRSCGRSGCIIPRKR